MHRLPWPTECSWGADTLTILLSCTCKFRLQPTPQYVHTVVVLVCFDSSQVSAARMSYSVLNDSAPVGHTSTQLPQKTHAESGSSAANSVEIWASNPRPAIWIAKVFCH